MNANNRANTTKKILISCGVVLLVSCILLVIFLLTGVGVTLRWPFNLESEGTESTIATQANPVSTQTIPDPEGELPDQLANTIEDIESQVVAMRGLVNTQSVEHTMISADELEKIVIEDFFAEYSDEDARQDVLVLSSLGLLPEKFKLKGLYEDLYTEQIAGFYDDETKQIYVVQGQDFGINEKLTYAHEFTHVLQDQIYDLDEGLGMNEESCEADSERCAAVQALIEGDASQTEILWFQTYASLDDYQNLMKMFDQLDTPVLDSAPPYIAADLYFPYEKGLAFVQNLYDKGGNEAVDSAFKAPPVSTEQILHPEKYPDDIPLQVQIPDLSQSLSDEWTLFDENVMGEWYTYLILNKGYSKDFQIPESQALSAAEGWGGDSYVIYINEETDETIFIMDTLWDSVEEAGEFVDAFYQYAALRWTSLSLTLSDARLWKGINSTIALWHDGDRTIWVMAPEHSFLEMIFIELQ